MNNAKIKIEDMKGILNKFKGIVGANNIGGNERVDGDFINEILDGVEYLRSIFEDIYPTDARIFVNKYDLVEIARWR